MTAYSGAADSRLPALALRPTLALEPRYVDDGAGCFGVGEPSSHTSIRPVGSQGKGCLCLQRDVLIAGAFQSRSHRSHVGPVLLSPSLQRGSQRSRPQRQHQKRVCRNFPNRCSRSSLPTGVSEDVARARECTLVPKCTRLVPAKNRKLAISGNTTCPFTGPLLKPSDGLEPSTPSLPWRFQVRRRVGGVALPASFFWSYAPSPPRHDVGLEHP